MADGPDEPFAQRVFAFVNWNAPSREERLSDSYKSLTEAIDVLREAAVDGSAESARLFDFVVEHAPNDEVLSFLGQVPIQDWLNTNLPVIAEWIVGRADMSENWRRTLRSVELYERVEQLPEAKQLRGLLFQGT